MKRYCVIDDDTGVVEKFKTLELAIMYSETFHPCETFTIEIIYQEVK